jgi:2-polyprenyl-6-hydroxyphenyl methylase/3-demethylubiquinone-9 3-methyltransferase
MCGWLKDKFGLSWQITPDVLLEFVTNPDPAISQRAMKAMMQMRKIDIAAIKAAARG